MWQRMKRMGLGIFLVMALLLAVEGYWISSLLHALSVDHGLWCALDLVGIVVLAVVMFFTVAIGLVCWLMTHVHLFWAR